MITDDTFRACLPIPEGTPRSSVFTIPISAWGAILDHMNPMARYAYEHNGLEALKLRDCSGRDLYLVRDVL